MKALFNADCDLCNRFKPRCAVVHIEKIDDETFDRYQTAYTLCEDCRKLKRGKYKLDKKHK